MKRSVEDVYHSIIQKILNYENKMNITRRRGGSSKRKRSIKAIIMKMPLNY